MDPTTAVLLMHFGGIVYIPRLVLPIFGLMHAMSLDRSTIARVRFNVDLTRVLATLCLVT